MAEWFCLYPQLPRAALDDWCVSRHNFTIVPGCQLNRAGVGGFDAPVHISEEASNARTVVPWAILSAVGISGVLGWGKRAIRLEMRADVVNRIRSHQRRHRLLHGHRLGEHPAEPHRTAHGYGECHS